MSLEVEGQNVMMEIDTGASVSVISMEEYQRRWPGVALLTTDIQLRIYTGEQLKVLGARNVDVQYSQQQATLPLVVVAAKGYCLLGRDWLCHLRLDWPSIWHIEKRNLETCPICRVGSPNRTRSETGWGICANMQ